MEHINTEKNDKSHSKRVLEVEQASFIPFVFTISGSMGNECKVFYFRLAELLSIKRKVENSPVVS